MIEVTMADMCVEIMPGVLSRPILLDTDVYNRLCGEYQDEIEQVLGRPLDLFSEEDGRGQHVVYCMYDYGQWAVRVPRACDDLQRNIALAKYVALRRMMKSMGLRNE